MASFATPKNQYVVWDGSNLAEAQELDALLLVGEDGDLRTRRPLPGGGSTSDHLANVGEYVVLDSANRLQVFPTEAEFLVRFNPPAVSS